VIRTNALTGSKDVICGAAHWLNADAPVGAKMGFGSEPLKGTIAPACSACVDGTCIACGACVDGACSACGAGAPSSTRSPAAIATSAASAFFDGATAAAAVLALAVLRRPAPRCLRLGGWSSSSASCEK
jgi:hypothetical protein